MPFCPFVFVKTYLFNRGGDAKMEALHLSGVHAPVAGFFFLFVLSGDNILFELSAELPEHGSKKGASPQGEPREALVRKLRLRKPRRKASRLLLLPQSASPREVRHSLESPHMLGSLSFQRARLSHVAQLEGSWPPPSSSSPEPFFLALRFLKICFLRCFLRMGRTLRGSCSLERRMGFQCA